MLDPSVQPGDEAYRHDMHGMVVVKRYDMRQPSEN